MLKLAAIVLSLINPSPCYVKTLQPHILLERWRHFHDCPHFPAQQNMTELWISHSAISGDIQLSYSRDFSRFYYRTPTLEALLGQAWLYVVAIPTQVRAIQFSLSQEKLMFSPPPTLAESFSVYFASPAALFGQSVSKKKRNLHTALPVLFLDAKILATSVLPFQVFEGFVRS